jgi:hypothetical protein
MPRAVLVKLDEIRGDMTRTDFITGLILETDELIKHLNIIVKCEAEQEILNMAKRVYFQGALDAISSREAKYLDLTQHRTPFLRKIREFQWKM